MTICKAFVRPHLDYGDIIYIACNEAFHQKFEYIQYNACRAISEAIRGSSREKLFKIRLVIPRTLTLVQETLLI